MSIKSIFKNNHFEWIDVESPTEEDLNFLQNRYEINNLLLEDTIDRDHLPKFEEVDGVKFFLTRENTDLERNHLNSISDISTKLGIFIIDKLIITIHRIRNLSISETEKEIKEVPHHADLERDSLALILALKVIRSYDDEVKNLQELLDKMENEIFLKNTSDTNQIRRLYRLKRKSGLNTRLLNLSGDWVNAFKTLNLKEVEVADLIDKQKDVIADFDHLNAQVTNLISMYLALTDQKANQVMKVLAIYSMYFFPITFIAGIYGMNFENMPELKEKNAYFITLGVMAFIALLTFLYVRRKRW